MKHLSAPHLASFRNQSLRGNEPAVRRDDSSARMAKEDCDLGVRAMQMRSAMPRIAAIALAANMEAPPWSMSIVPT